jgi:hypothetical protein
LVMSQKNSLHRLREFSEEVNEVDCIQPVIIITQVVNYLLWCQQDFMTVVINFYSGAI